MYVQTGYWITSWTDLPLSEQKTEVYFLVVNPNQSATKAHWENSTYKLSHSLKKHQFSSNYK